MPKPPLPEESPQPPMFPALDEPPTDPKIRIVSHRLKWATGAIAGGFSALSLAGVAIAYEKLESKASDAGMKAAMVVTAGVDAGLQALAGRTAAVEQQVPQLRAEVGQLREETYQQRLDSRDLYKAVMEGRRSERLETPPPKPPPPPPAPKDGGR